MNLDATKRHRKFTENFDVQADKFDTQERSLIEEILSEMKHRMTSMVAQKIIWIKM